MSSSIFHEYDIRGRYPGEVNEAIFYNLGQAYWQAFKPKKIAIGRDARLSSDTLFLYLASALQNRKVKTIDLGRVSTPSCLWYSQKYKVDTLMITASHNPKDQNGLKIFSAQKGIIDKKSGLAKLENIFKKLDFSAGKIEKPVLVKKINLLKEYVDQILGWVKIPRSKARIAIDFSNGVGGPEFVWALEKLKIDFATLNEIANGNFPAHGPNPLLAESQKGLKVLMKSGKFAVGAVVDGDGDRVLFLDEKGETIDPSHLFSLVIDLYLVPQKAKAIVKNIALARIVDETAKSAGIRLNVVPVGRTKMQAMMKKNKAVLGVEKSGHYFFKDFYYGDSALLALLTVLNILSRQKKKLSQLLEPYRRYIILPEINLPFEGRVDKIIGAVKEKYKDGAMSELDGLTIEYPDYRFNLRRSNTENLWRLNLEGPDREKLEGIKKEIEAIIIT